MRILVTGGSGFIGTNYIEFLLKNGQAEFINLSYGPPRNVAHKNFWRKCDLLDAPKLKKIIKDFSPTHVVHLAAKCGLYNSLDVYAANIQGVENLLLALQEAPSVERVIFTSSLLVCRPGYVPNHDTDYKPYTLYGVSKMRGEQIVREYDKNMPYAWTIIRPISIWGPWCGDPFKAFFKAIAQGWYFHIGSGHCRKTFGYVENTVYQIHQLLLAPLEKVDRKTIYVADTPPVDLYDFANEIQKELNTKKIWHMPLGVAKLFAKAGDVLKAIGWRNVPLTSFRLNNMRTELIYDDLLQPVLEICGSLPYDLKRGVKRTIEWMREAGEI